MKFNLIKIELAIDARKGRLTIAEIAEFIGIAERTLYYWRTRGKEIYVEVEVMCTRSFDSLNPNEEGLLRLYHAFSGDDAESFEKRRLELEAQIEEKASEAEERREQRLHRLKQRKATHEKNRRLPDIYKRIRQFQR